MRQYVDYYHSCRTHLSLEKDAPEPRRVESPAMGKVRAIPKVGGLHHYLHSTRRCLSRSARDGYGTSRQLTPIPLSRSDADPRNVLHEDDPSILVAGSSLISRSSSLWKGQEVFSPEVRAGERFTGLLDKAQQLLDDERFFNWQVAFPGVWSEWESAGLTGGFDAVIGNPPWDRMKLQQVEWFAARRRELAMAQRASDRKRMIADLEKAGDPLARDFEEASERTTAAVRMARDGGDYPVLCQNSALLK